MRRAKADQKTDQEPQHPDAKGMEKSVRNRLALREIHGHVTVTRDTLTAWFVLSPQPWSFTTEQQREHLIRTFARRLAALTGYRCHLRVTSRPYPARKWAENTYARYPHPLGGNARGSQWDDHLVTTQTALHSSTLADKEVFIGIEFKSRNWLTRLLGAGRGLDGARKEIEDSTETLDRLHQIVAGPGMEARPAATEEIEWLIHRSVRLGMPAPTRLTSSQHSWEVYDMPSFTDGVRYTYEKFGKSVKIEADYGTKTVTRHVVVLTTGRMSDITVPQKKRDPWMQHTDRMKGVPIEWSATFDVLHGKEVGKRTARKRLAIRDMQKQYREHGLEVPQNLSRKAAHALDIEDRTLGGDSDIVDSTGSQGVYRIAVSGATEKEALKNAQRVIDSYEGQIDIMHPRKIGDGAAQLPMMMEFVPGQPVSTWAYMRRLPIEMLAAAMPHVTARIGDRSGAYMGYTAGTSRRAFIHDLHRPMEIEETMGTIVTIGTQGAGKSGLTGKLAYEETVAGVVSTVLDPADRLGALCDIPRLKGHSQHLDLVAGQDGSLSPWLVVADPLRENFESDDKYHDAFTIAEKTRKLLAAEVVRSLLPAQVDRLPETPLLLADAIRAVGGSRDKSLWDVVEQLEKRRVKGRVEIAGKSRIRHEPDALATSLANYLRDMAEMPQSRLFFPNSVYDYKPITDTLLVMTLGGLQLPDEGMDREDWGPMEQVSVPLLQLASHLATSRAYGLSKDERKFVALDEAELVARWTSGRTLFKRLSRDTRKWNICALIASQNAGDIRALNIGNFINAVYAGRTEDYETAQEALKLLRLALDQGYENTLANLSPQVARGEQAARRGAREFIVRKGQDVEKAVIDMSHLPDLLAAIDTTAKPKGVAEPVLA